MNAKSKKEIKSAIENKLGHIDDETFEEAFDRAARKQARIFTQSGVRETLKPWYLQMLTEEELKSLEMENFTLNLYKIRNQERVSNFNTLSIEDILEIHIKAGVSFPISRGVIIGAFICLK